MGWMSFGTEAVSTATGHSSQKTQTTTLLIFLFNFHKRTAVFSMQTLTSTKFVWQYCQKTNNEKGCLSVGLIVIDRTKIAVNCFISA